MQKYDGALQYLIGMITQFNGDKKWVILPIERNGRRTELEKK